MRIVARTLLRSLVLVLAPALPAHAQASPATASDAPPVRAIDRIGGVLLEARAGEVETQVLAHRIAAAIGADIALAYDTLVGGTFAVRVSDLGSSVRRITREEHEALIQAFAELRWADVEEFLAARLAENPGESVRTVALSILGAHGRARNALTLLEWTAPASSARVSRTLGDAFEAALGALLARHPAAARAVIAPDALPPLALLPGIVGALGANPTNESIETLTELLGRVPRADAWVISEIAHVARAMRAPIPAATRDRVRGYLWSEDRALLAAAVTAAARLQDPQALERLIALAGESSDPNVKQGAVAALVEISGEHLGPDPLVWTDWHANLVHVHTTQAAHLLERALHGPPQIASRAILELTKLRPYRHELAPALSAVLERPEEELLVLACAALGHLGSRCAVPALCDALAFESVEVRRAAFQALRRITGEDHGEFAGDWRAAGW